MKHIPSTYIPNIHTFCCLFFFFLLPRRAQCKVCYEVSIKLTKKRLTQSTRLLMACLLHTAHCTLFRLVFAGKVALSDSDSSSSDHKNNEEKKCEIMAASFTWYRLYKKFFWRHTFLHYSYSHYTLTNTTKYTCLALFLSCYFLALYHSILSHPLAHCLSLSILFFSTFYNQRQKTITSHLLIYLFNYLITYFL